MQLAQPSTRRYFLGLFLILGLYGFVTALTGFKEAWGLAFSTESSGSTIQSILDISLATPFTRLLCGIIITSLIQSSSATIALVVATVASGAISAGDSVFILMGANIGTTVTNTIVGIAHGHKEEEFKRITPAILVDDIFKILNVFIFFIIEITTGLLQTLSTGIVNFLESETFMGSFLEMFPDLIDIVTMPVINLSLNLIAATHFGPGFQALVFGIAFFVLLLVSLALMEESLESYLHNRSREMINLVFIGKYSSFMVGFVLCWLLQSSSVTVSLILPLVSQSAVQLHNVYYYSIGAALATTCDPGQIVSYLKFGPLGLMVGMVHILLNIFGSILFLTVPGLNKLPIRISEYLSNLMCRNRHAALLLILYVVMLFFVIPMLMIYLSNLF